MAYQIVKYSDVPHIFVIKFRGIISPEEVLEACNELAQQAEGLQRPVYQIGDWREADGNLSNVLQIAKIIPDMQQLYKKAQITGPLIVNELSNPWLRLSRDLAARFRFGGFKMMVFDSVENCAEFIKVNLMDKSTA